MWISTALSLLIIAILTLISVLLQVYDTMFRMSYANAQLDIQKQEAEKFKEMEESAKKDQEEFEKISKSQNMSEIGKLGGLAKQKMKVEGDFWQGVVSQPEVEVGLAILNQINPELAEYVTAKPHLIPQALELLKKLQNSGSVATPQIPNISNGRTAKSGW